jgi:hypothetical protein
MLLVWVGVLLAVAVGPIDYALHPSWSVLIIVGFCVALFCLGSQAGIVLFSAWLRRRATLQPLQQQTLNRTVVVASLLGLAGIGMIAIDRAILSGVNNTAYAALLRCAPELIDYIETKRTFLIYVGYLTFSFGFASLALFFLLGEKLRGWPAVLAQLSILSPVGYALLYSGRTPILLMIAIIISICMVRLVQGKSLLPGGHYLVIKTIVFVALFMVYADMMWSARQSFCVRMSSVVEELRLRVKEQAARAQIDAQMRRAEILRDLAGNSLAGEEKHKLEQQLAVIDRDIGAAEEKKMRGAVDAETLNSMIEKKMHSSGFEKQLQGNQSDFDRFAAIMREAWYVQPRGYVVSAVDSHFLSEKAAQGILSNYFYLTHSVRILDMIWRARDNLTPMWGVYEVGILSPILRIFFPHNQLIPSMNTQLRSTQVYGFYPSAWGAAYLDFGRSGAILYIVLWGFFGGVSFYGSRRTTLATPPLILTFVFASILLSPLQGPLGISNSALVLASMLIVGVVIDYKTLKQKRLPSRTDGMHPNPGSP